MNPTGSPITPNPTDGPSALPSKSPNVEPVEMAVVVHHVQVKGHPIENDAGPWMFEAESTIFGHMIGSVSANEDAWTVIPSQGTNNHVLFGPYTGLIPTGQRTAKYRIKKIG